MKKTEKQELPYLISGKTDFKMKAINKGKEGHYLMIKESIQEEDITIINIYASNMSIQIHTTNINTQKRRN